MIDWLKENLNTVLGCLGTIIGPVCTYLAMRKRSQINYQSLFIKTQNEFVTSLMKDQEQFRQNLTRELRSTKNEVKEYKKKNEILQDDLLELRGQVESLIILNNQLNDTKVEYSNQIRVLEQKVVRLEEEVVELQKGIVERDITIALLVTERDENVEKDKIFRSGD